MYEPAGSPISLLFMIVVIFLFVYLIDIRPWRRRRKKKASLSKQVKISSITLFIYSGLGFVGTAIYLLFQRELSLIGIIGIAVAADHSATAILIMKRSTHALKSLMGAIALYLFSFSYIRFSTYSNNGTSIMFFIFVGIGGLIGVACLYSPVLRGIFAIRELEREVKSTSDSINDMA
jgi:hypothetical protein